MDYMTTNYLHEMDKSLEKPALLKLTHEEMENLNRFPSQPSPLVPSSFPDVLVSLSQTVIFSGQSTPASLTTHRSITLRRCVSVLSCVRLFATLWTAAHLVPLSMGFSRQEYWSGQPFLSPGDLSNSRIKPGFPAMQADSLPSEPPRKPLESNPSFLLPFFTSYNRFLITS